MQRPFQFKLWQLIAGHDDCGHWGRVDPHGVSLWLWADDLVSFRHHSDALHVLYRSFFSRGVGLRYLGLALLASLLLLHISEVIGAEFFRGYVGVNVAVPLGVVIGGVVGGVMTSFLAGVAGGIIATFIDELS